MSPFDPFRGGVAKRGQCPLFLPFFYMRASLCIYIYLSKFFNGRCRGAVRSWEEEYDESVYCLATDRVRILSQNQHHTLWPPGELPGDWYFKTWQSSCVGHASSETSLHAPRGPCTERAVQPGLDSCACLSHHKGSPFQLVTTSMWALPVWGGGSKPLPGWFGALF